MPQGLPVSRLIGVDVNLTPLAAQFLGFNTLLILGSSTVIDLAQRIRSYNTLDQVAADFGTVTDEFLAAELFFSQIPQPSQLYIGRWAATAAQGQLVGANLSPAQQVISTWTSITNGAFLIPIDGAPPESVVGCNFSSVTNLNGVATVINGHMAGATIAWTGDNFVVTSNSTGTISSVGFATSPGSGTDISTMLGLTAASSGVYSVQGIAAESLVTCVTIMDGLATSWYGLMVVASQATDNDRVAVAAYIEGAGGATNPHVFGVSSSEPGILNLVSTTDIAAQLAAGQYTRSFVQFSNIKHAAASFFGRAFTVNFAANNSTITMMWKQEPGVVAEALNSSQVAALEQKRANVYVGYNNNTAIIEAGTMAGPAYFDEIYGLDWLANQIQTDLYNTLYTSPTKIPQTDAGNHVLATTIEAACIAGVNNGLIGPGGQWNSAGFGALNQGDILPKGYYVFAPPIATQAQADREARKSVPFQVAVKLAGAIHTVDAIINVNR